MSVLTAVTARIFNNTRSESKFNLTAAHVRRLRTYWPIFVREAQRTSLSPYMLAGIAWGESDFIASALNDTSGAAGLMQVMPDEWGGRTYRKQGWAPGDEFNPDKNVKAGADLLAYHYRVRKDYQVPNRRTLHTERALASYGGFVTWLKTGAAPEFKKDPSWYIDEAMGRAFLLELMHTAGKLEL